MHHESPIYVQAVTLGYMINFPESQQYNNISTNLNQHYSACIKYCSKSTPKILNRNSKLATKSYTWHCNPCIIQYFYYPI